MQFGDSALANWQDQQDEANKLRMIVCRDIDDIISKKLSAGILLYVIDSYVKSLDILSNF